MTRKAPPASNPLPDAAPFTLSDADITSQRAVPRPRLPGVVGAGAAAAAFGNTDGAAAADHDGPPSRGPTPRKVPDGD